MRRKFKIERHEEYGYVGLAPTWMSEAQTDPLTGMGVAHDVLEHGNNDRVEWQGLGGSVLVRGSGYFGRRPGNPDTVENIASDFVNLFHLWEGQDIPDPGRTVTLPDRDDDELIHAIVHHGCRDVVTEMMGDDEREKEARHWVRLEQQQRMIGWMRKGYRAAAKRWAGHIGMITETFIAIEEAVDKFLKHHEDYIGATAIITFDPTSASARVDLEEEADY